jgi:hypothetical protein
VCVEAGELREEEDLLDPTQPLGQGQVALYDHVRPFLLLLSVLYTDAYGRSVQTRHNGPLRACLPSPTSFAIITFQFITSSRSPACYAIPDTLCACPLCNPHSLLSRSIRHALSPYTQPVASAFPSCLRLPCTTLSTNSFAAHVLSAPAAGSALTVRPTSIPVTGIHLGRASIPVDGSRCFFFSRGDAPVTGAVCPARRGMGDSGGEGVLPTARYRSRTAASSSALRARCASRARGGPY